MIWSWHSFIANECYIDVLFNFEQAMWFIWQTENLHLVFGFVLFLFLLGMWEVESRPNYKKWISDRRLHMYFSYQPARLPHRITLCVWKARRIVPKKQSSVNWVSVWCFFHNSLNFSFHCSWDHFLLSSPDTGHLYEHVQSLPRAVACGLWCHCNVYW